MPRADDLVLHTWWRSNMFHQTKSGFATLDLFADGTFERVYHTYDWLSAMAR